MDRVLDIVFVITIISSVLPLEANYKPPIAVSLSSRFPTSEQKVSESSLDEPKITEECRKRGYCLPGEVHEYPVELVTSLAISGGIKNKTDGDPHIAQRDGDETNPPKKYVELCDSAWSKIAPHSLPDRMGKFLIVANVPGVVEQIFHIERCNFSINDTSPRSCSSDFQLVSPAYTSVCKQIYVYRQVYVIVNKKLEEKDMRLNGCCSCVIRRKLHGL